MSKTPETLDLEARLLRYTSGQFGCDEVTVGYAGSERVDYMSVDFKGIWRCYEVKVTKSDFRSKAKVTFVGNYNYYVMPEALYDAVKTEIPAHVGVLVPCGSDILRSAKKASKRPLGTDEKLLTGYLIRSLFRTYERVKLSGDETEVQKYRRRIAHLEDQAKENTENYNRESREVFMMKLFLRRHGLLQEYEGWVETA